MVWLCQWFVCCNTSTRLNKNIDYLPSQWQFCSTVVMNKLYVSHVISLNIWHQIHWPFIKMWLESCHYSIYQLLPHRGGICALQDSMWVIFFNHYFLWKSMHSSLHFTYNEAIFYMIKELIFIDDLLWDDVNWYSHILISGHWRVEVEVLNMNYNKFGVQHWKYAVKYQLICKNVWYGSSNIAGVIDYISAHCEAYLVWLFLLWAKIHTVQP